MFIMKIKILYMFAVFIFLISGGYAQETDADESSDDVQKEKIVIYYFQDKSRTNLYRYYSYIIPNSLEADIVSSGRYEVKVLPVVNEYADASATEDESGNNIRVLADRGKEFSADYLVIGAYTVENARIIIKTQLFDVDKQKIEDIEETSNKIGVMLLAIIDDITNKLNLELDKSYQVKTEEKKKIEEERRIEEEERAASSPFLSLYRLMSGASFGINYGHVDISGEWEKMYNSAESVGLYLSYETGFFGISGTLDYFSTNSDESETSEYSVRSYFSLWETRLNAFYVYRLSSLFNLNLAAGAGAVQSEVTFETGDGPVGNIKSGSTDPCFALSVSGNFIFGGLKITSGISFNYVFYSDEALTFSIIYFGFGYQI